MPTHPLLHVRNAADAHIVFEAVRLGLLPLIRRRLTPAERDALTSGQVFVWEETDISGGLSRWTDGRRWSQSRMREPFLFYEEKVLPTLEEKRAKAERRARKAKLDPLSASFGQQHQNPNSQFSTSTFPSSPSTSSSSSSSYDDKPCRRQDRPSKPDGLTKQTYSSYVPASASMISNAKKWHIVAYFNTASYATLPTVDDYPELRVLTVRDGTWGASSSAALAAAAIKNSKSERGVNNSGLLTRQIVPRFSPSAAGIVPSSNYFRDGSEDVEMVSVDGDATTSNSGGSSFSYSATSSSASNTSASGSPAPSFTSLPSRRSSHPASSSHPYTTNNGYSTYSSPAPSSPYAFSPLSSISSSPRSAAASRAVYTPSNASSSSSIASTPSVSVASLLNPIASPSSSSSYSTYSTTSCSSLSSFSTMSSISSTGPAPTTLLRQPAALPAPRCAEDSRALGAFRITF